MMEGSSSSAWSKYEEFMEQADSSILDQIRLLSLESLYRKTVEYHQNYHSYLPSTSPSGSQSLEGEAKRVADTKLSAMVDIYSFDDAT
jgi:hypothetical protein